MAKTVRIHSYNAHFVTSSDARWARRHGGKRRYNTYYLGTWGRLNIMICCKRAESRFTRI